ncbi:MAG TPA: hypothetical protein VFI91_04840 [Longimicrobiaceae bacterium]|nr:hypothetical protein [Longimicrobiaceae bacterium]
MRLLSVLLLLLIPQAVLAQAPVAYEVTFPNAIHHEAEISVTFPNVPAGPLEVRMSRSSPGRYALHEFAKNVYSVEAFNSSGEPLEITRPNPYQWNVEGHDGTVRVTYTLFGDQVDGTYAAIDNTHAHLNMPATFMWARGLEDRPIEITFHPPEPEWKVATQLAPTSDPMRFTAPHLQYFLDSPTQLSAFDMRQWTVPSPAGEYTIRFALHHQGTAEQLDEYAEMVEKVVAEQIAVFGEPADYDYGTYTFIADYLPYADGDGMEHRNSTIITSSRPLSTGAMRNLGTVSHEFFHSWNVERIRPAGLEPFDFERANMSDALWFAEGFTSYYTNLIIRRAGLISIEDYAHSLSGALNAVINSPGREYFTPVEMSRQAPFVDAATSVDPQNKRNTFISYYTWGSAIGLGLDLQLRERFGVTVDDYMRGMWEEYGVPEEPYTIADLQAELAELTGDAAFADQFFSRYIEGHEVVDYARLLAGAGFLLRRANPGEPWLGQVDITFEDGDAVVSGGTFVGAPLYEAGLDRGANIISIGGEPINSKADIDRILATHRPGDALPIEFELRGESISSTLTLQENPRVEVVTYEEVGQEVTPEMAQLRQEWLGSNAR